MNTLFKFVLVVAGSLLAGGVFADPAGLIAPLPTGFTRIAPAADLDHFTFIAAGDNRSAGHGTPMPAPFAEICREIGLIHPPFVMWTGDVIEGYNDTVPEANAEYDTFLAGLSLCGVPVYNAPGNHEFSLDSALLPVYLKRVGALTGTFDYGNSHFIVLNTTPVEPDGTMTSGTLDEAEFTWLERDLAAHQSAANIFVAMHHYPFGPAGDDPTFASGWSDHAARDRFHALMVKYHVRAVLSSHDHIYWHKNIDGVDYYVSGGAGAPLDATPDAGGYLHFVVFHVDGTKLTADTLQPWRLVTDSGPSVNGSATVRVSNYNYFPVAVNNVSVRVAAAPAGSHLAVTGMVIYKKSKPAAASLVSVTPIPGTGDVTAVISTVVAPARTVALTVAPVADGAGK